MRAIFYQDPDPDPFFTSAGSGSGSVKYQPGSTTLLESKNACSFSALPKNENVLFQQFNDDKIRRI